MFVALAILCGCGGSDGECTDDSDCSMDRVCVHPDTADSVCDEAKEAFSCCYRLTQIAESNPYASARECAAVIANGKKPDFSAGLIAKLEDECWMLQ